MHSCKYCEFFLETLFWKAAANGLFYISFHLRKCWQFFKKMLSYYISYIITYLILLIYPIMFGVELMNTHREMGKNWHCFHDIYSKSIYPEIVKKRLVFNIIQESLKKF